MLIENNHESSGVNINLVVHFIFADFVCRWLCVLFRAWLFPSRTLIMIARLPDMLAIMRCLHSARFSALLSTKVCRSWLRFCRDYPPYGHTLFVSRVFCVLQSSDFASYSIWMMAFCWRKAVITLARWGEVLSFLCQENPGNFALQLAALYSAKCPCIVHYSRARQCMDYFASLWNALQTWIGSPPPWNNETWQSSSKRYLGTRRNLIRPSIL